MSEHGHYAGTRVQRPCTIAPMNDVWTQNCTAEPTEQKICNKYTRHTCRCVMRYRNRAKIYFRKRQMQSTNRSPFRFQQHKSRNIWTDKQKVKIEFATLIIIIRMCGSSEKALTREKKRRTENIADRKFIAISEWTEKKKMAIIFFCWTEVVFLIIRCHLFYSVRYMDFSRFGHFVTSEINNTSNEKKTVRVPLIRWRYLQNAPSMSSAYICWTTNPPNFHSVEIFNNWELRWKREKMTKPWWRVAN